MAILSKIRNRSGFLILIIGLAMISFVLNPKDLIDFFSNKKKNLIGKVNDEKLSYLDFLNRLEGIKSQNSYASRQVLTLENMVWDQMVKEKIYQLKTEQSGINITEDEIWKAIISNRDIINSPKFRDKNGQFNEELLKNYVSKLSSDHLGGQGLLKQWIDYEKWTKNNLMMSSYDELIQMGIDDSKREISMDFSLKNTNISVDYVFLPFSLIGDEEIKVTENEVASYIEKYKERFKTDGFRNLKVVKFPLTASEEDEKKIEESLSNLIDDREVYDKFSKKNEWKKGFKNTEDMVSFLEEHPSDLPSIDTFQFEDAFSSEVKEDIKQASKGMVIGPYKISDCYKIFKILDIRSLPSSVKARHILISFDTAKNINSEEKAKKIADSILSVVKKSPSKFTKLAKDFSSDEQNASKGGDLDWFGYTHMIPKFRDFCFENKKGYYGIVKTVHGFHVIHIENQKEFKTGYKLATIARKIGPSEKTENEIFKKAESFLEKIRDGKNFEKIAEKSDYTVNPISEVKELDVSLSGMSQIENTREIIKWAFDKKTKLHEAKLFDLNRNGYAVFILSKSREKGLKHPDAVFEEVSPLLIKERKAAILEERMKEDTLEAIASSNNVSIEKFENVTLKNPVIPDIGIEPEVVSACLASKKDALIRNVIGRKGVFVLITRTTNPPPETEIEETEQHIISRNLKSKISSKFYSSLKKDALIEDYRALNY